MIAFYLEAVRMDAGRFVELRFYNGTPEGSKAPLGAVNFTVPEWETFRPMLIAAMRWAGHHHIPVALKDQTRNRDPKSDNVIRIVR